MLRDVSGKKVSNMKPSKIGKDSANVFAKD
jgi:hypothetical protein